MTNNYNPKKGDFFVSLAEDFENVKMLNAVEEKTDLGQLYAAYYVPAEPGKKAQFLKKKIEEFQQPFFPIFYSRKPIAGQEKEFELYIRISNKIEDYLLSRKGYSGLIPEVIEYLYLNGESREEVEAIIKVLIGELILYKYKKLKSGEYLEFSGLKSNAESSRLYYGSIADEIRIKSEKIELLVSHGQTVGNYREYILRDLLKKYIPSKFKVATGFIEGLSRQIDIIIYDALNHAPTFIEGDLVVVRREAVRAIIEVKSVLTTSKLQESLQFFYDITRPGIYKPDIPVFKGIFAFDTFYTDSHSMAKCVEDFYKKPYFEEQLQENMVRYLQYLNHEITCITVLKKHCLFSKYTYANGAKTDNVVPALLSVSDRRNTDVQSAMFIALLFNYLDVDLNAKLSTSKAFSKLYQSKAIDVKLEVKLTDDDWFPSTAKKNEHDSTQDSIKVRLKKIDDWFNGYITTNEFLNDNG